MGFVFKPFYCSFCGTKSERVRYDGKVKGMRPIEFKSPFHGCKTLIGCKACSSKFRGKEADQFFCNLCGIQINVTESKTGIDRKDGAPVLIRTCEDYGYETTFLVCLDGEQRYTNGFWMPTSIHHDLIYKSMQCRTCGLLVNIYSGTDDGECANCGTYATGAGNIVAPELFNE